MDSVYGKNYQCTQLEIIGFSLVRSALTNKIFSFFMTYNGGALNGNIIRLKKNLTHCYMYIDQST